MRTRWMPGTYATAAIAAASRPIAVGRATLRLEVASRAANHFRLLGLHVSAAIASLAP